MNKLKNRLIFYLSIVTGAVVLSWLIAIGIILATKNRYDGLTYGPLASMIFLQLVSGYIFLHSLSRRVSYAIVGSIIFVPTLTIFNMLLLEKGLIRTGWDIYGFWDALLLFCITTILFFEFLFQLSTILDRKFSNE